VTITVESSKNGAATLSRMNYSGYVVHATIFSSVFTTACCLVVLGLGLELGLDLVSGWFTGYAYVFVRVSIVVVTLPSWAHVCLMSGVNTQVD